LSKQHCCGLRLLPGELLMAELTPRDDVRKAASEILKRVDQLIRAGEIDHSIREIIHAKEIDPANVYVRAYEERLAFLKEEHEKNAEREKTKKEAERAAREKDEELRKRQEEERTKQEEERKKHLEEQNCLERERMQQQEQSPIPQEIPRVRESAPAGREPLADGTPEHVYMKAFKKAWSEGKITVQRALSLEQLGKELGITPERQLGLEKQLHAEPRAEHQPTTILIIDDDESMLSVFTSMLTEHGYEVIALTTSDDAYALLKKWKPGLILCDVNLETSTMGGFSFYEKIRKFEHLHQVPFIFLTGLSDEILIRTGKELGADDYLTKPISEQNLVAAIKGKIKRFRELKGTT
jgi:CheY-like chemotaxis protein